MKKKLTEEKAMITKADKDKSIIILYVDDYNRKIDTFISNNSFTQSTNDITIKLRVSRTAINEWCDIIPKDEKWKYINLNPEAPSIRGLVKIHKEDSPIGPIISWKNAPAYKLAKVLVEKHQTYIALLYTFNVKNTTHLIHDLFDIPYDQNLKFASFDITNMYTNIPTSELVTIIDITCQNNYIENSAKSDIIKLTKTITDQNYFQFLDKTYIQSEGLAKGTPTSSIFSEFYLQYLENTKIYNFLLNHNIEGYLCYVDDILIVYKENRTNVNDVLDCFNKLTPKLK